MAAQSSQQVKNGRPSSFSQDKADTVCSVIEAGGTFEALEREHGITSDSIYRWLDANEQFRVDYARARQNQAHSFVERIAAMTDKVLAGQMTTEQFRVATEALKWMAGKRLSTVYGDKLQVSGHQGLTINILRGTEAPALPAESIDAEYLEMD